MLEAYWIDHGHMTQGFFPVCWEWGRVPCNWENSAVLVQFGKNLKQNEHNKLRKFTLRLARYGFSFHTMYFSVSGH